MDLIDEKIKKVLNTKISTSENYKRTIKTTLYENDNTNNFKIFKMLRILGTACACLIITTGVGVATYTVGNKIWKQPQSYTITKELSEEEKNKCISEQEAEKIANSYLEKIGLANKEVGKLNLTKEYFSNEKIWQIGIEAGTITIDAETGKIKSVQIPTWNYKIPYNFGITREEARKVAKELLEKYRPEGDKGEYKLIKLTHNMNNDEGSYIWYACFQKKYGDLLNPEEEINIGWIPTINALYSLSIENNGYDNNEQVITEEDAIKIATETDKKIETKRQIKSTKAEIRIKSMNPNVYIRENYKEEYESGKWNLERIGENSYKVKDDAVFFETEGLVRKVWVVVIEYNTLTDEEFPGFTYYVDSTTGEVIGGERGIWVLDSEKNLYNDPYNLIEK